MKRSLVMLGVSAVALTLSFTSCSPEDEPTDAPSDSPTTGASSTSPGPPSLEDATILAPGDGLRVIGRTSGELAPRTHVSVGAVTPDGQLVVDVARRNLANPLDLNQAKVALRDPSTGTLDYISHGRGRDGNQIGGVAANRRWIVWVETPSTDLATNPWRLYAYHRGTGRHRLVATAPRVTGPVVPRAPGDSYPTILGDRVYIAAVHHVEGGAAMPSVYSAALTGVGGLREEYRGQILPGAGDRTIVTLDARAHQGRYRGEWKIMNHNPSDGSSRVLASGRGQVGDVLHAGQRTAWFTRSDGTTRLHVTTAGSESPRVVVATEKQLGYPTITDRYVTFVAGNDTPGVAYLYDFGSAQLHRLTRHPIAVGESHGDYLVWNRPTARSAGDAVVARLTQR